MQITMLKSKIHRARVTGANLDYEGSISIDRKLVDEANLLVYEQVEVLNINNGARFTTYVIEAPEGSGEISLNGAAARLAIKNDTVIIVSYCRVDEDEARNFLPRLVYVDEHNHIKSVKNVMDNVVSNREDLHAR
ncbi:MAG: aspartate 1-decarboxylase [Dehalococcoidaceae bacterium]|nr:aspartate 1-decarboxylase [Dehalococcoidaceae bacterium]